MWIEMEHESSSARSEPPSMRSVGASDLQVSVGRWPYWTWPLAAAFAPAALDELDVRLTGSELP